MCPEINNEIKYTEMTIERRTSWSKACECGCSKEDSIYSYFSCMNFCTVPYADEKLKIQIHYLFQNFYLCVLCGCSMIDTVRQSSIVKGQKFMVH